MRTGLASIPAEVWYALSLSSLAGLLLALIALPRIVARLPADWFGRPPVSFRDRYRAAPLRSILRNVCGVALLFGGVAMLVLPGQGLLTILVGLLISDLPLRERWIRGLIRRRQVALALQRMRLWAGVPPFEGLPTPDTHGA